MQLSFRKIEFVQGLTVFLASLIFAYSQREQANRQELGWREAIVDLEPVSMKGWDAGGLALAGAWRLSSEDPRFGGISALALTGHQFVAVTDSGAVLQFNKPSAGPLRARIGELPGGPGSAGFKVNRDAESLVRDRSGRGWWVAFETRNELWLYDCRFEKALTRVRFGRDAWPRNRGIEAMAVGRDGLLVMPERGGSVVELRGRSVRTLPIENPFGRISDSTRLPSGELVIVNRRLTAFGISNSVALLEPTRRGYRYGRRAPLELGPLDNVEAVAAELIAGGVVRLWLMTDDANQRPFRTLLIALDMPLTRPAPQQPS